MAATSFVVMGLAFGDEGKGASASFLTRTRNAKFNVRFSGGCQAGHNVEHKGKNFCFSQLGSGSFHGAQTIIGPRFLFDPLALAREVEAFTEAHGSQPPEVLVHPQTPIVTPWHAAINRITEKVLRFRTLTDSPTTTCGRGIGACREYWLKYGNQALRAQDMDVGEDWIAYSKLVLLRDRMLVLASQLTSNISSSMVSFLLDDFNTLNTDPQRYLDQVQLSYDRDGWWSTSKIHLRDYYEDGKSDVIFEGSQGVLLDEWYGFPPYNTWSTTTADEALPLLSPGMNLVKVGVCRTTITRHGTGPLPTEDHTLRDCDPNNPFNPWQGTIREGWADLPLHRYALAVSKPDAIIVSHCDNVKATKFADLYKTTSLLSPVDMRDIPIYPRGLSVMQLKTAEALRNAKPIITEVSSVEHVVERLTRGHRVLALGRSPDPDTWENKL